MGQVGVVRVGEQCGMKFGVMANTKKRCVNDNALDFRLKELDDWSAWLFRTVQVREPRLGLIWL